MARKEPEGAGGCDAVEFFRVVRASFTVDEYRALQERAAHTIRVAKIRGLIPWEYDGERDNSLNAEFEWPDPPRWGEAA